jgi:hypothetical protein
MNPSKASRNSGPSALSAVERRQTPRCIYCTAVILRSIRGDTPGMVMNISSDGMFIQTETLFMKGEMVDLSFTYRSTQWTLSLKTIVVRTALGAIGIRIL